MRPMQAPGLLKPFPELVRIKKMRLLYKWKMYDPRINYHVLVMTPLHTTLLDLRDQIVGTVRTEDLEVVRW